MHITEPKSEPISKRCLYARTKLCEVKTSIVGFDLGSLTDDEQQALANLMPLLICGEESATFVFDDLANTLAGRLSAIQLRAIRSITSDEIRHSDDLDALRHQLPSPLDRRTSYRAAAFLKVLKSEDPVIRLARLAVLDAAVCQMLALLLHAEAPIAKCPEVSSIIRHIQLDEARHVRIIRDCYLKLGLSSIEIAKAQLQVLEAFILLLTPSTQDLQCLGLDFDLLKHRWHHKMHGRQYEE
jgi:hypothetical protein